MILNKTKLSSLPLGCLLAGCILLSGTAVLAQTGTLTINNPLNGQKFPVGGKLSVTAKPAVTGGTISKVEFFLKAGAAAETKLGEDTQTPFSVPWAMDTAGAFTLRALATGNQGAKIESAPVTVTVFQPATLTRAESFDTSLGTFSLELNNHNPPVEFGFSNTGTAGGQPGELGGVVVRSTSDAPIAVGTMDLGGNLLLSRHKIFLRGKFLLRQQDFDGGLGIGFILTDGSGFTGKILGVAFAEPGGGFEPDFRGYGSAAGINSPNFGVPVNVPHEFCLYWDPRDKTLRGTIAGQAVAVQNPGITADRQVNAFIAGSFGQGNASAQACEFHVDDLTYTIYDPATANDPFIDVSITAPLAYAAYPPGSSVTLSADATVDVGSIAKVEFFVLSSSATNKIGQATTAPYAAQWTAAAAGEYRIKAVATTAGGKSDASLEVTVYVAAPVTTKTLEEKFATGLGVFDLVVRNQYNDNNFGWANSNQAGGEVAGEFGGQFSDTSYSVPAYIGAGLKGLLLPSQQSLTLKGKAVMLTPNNPYDVFLGYVNTAKINQEAVFGFAFHAGNQTVTLQFPGAAIDPMPLPMEQPFTIDLTWNFQEKKLLGTIADAPIDVSVDQVAPMAFDAVVLGSFGPGTGSRGALSFFFVDDLSFTVAEEAAPPPKLSIARQGNNVTLGWQGAGFRLRERNSLSAGAWSDSSAQVISAGDSHTATVTAEGTARFYRLEK